MNTPAIPRMLCHALAVCAFLPSLHAQERSSISSEARILGEVNDGSAEPAPALAPLAARVLESRTQPLGQRRLTVERVAPLSLPAPAVQRVAPAEVAYESSSIESLEEVSASSKLLFGSVHVFHLADTGEVLAFVRLSPMDGKSPVELWSAVDWGVFGGFGSFADGEGNAYALLLTASRDELPDRAALAATVAEHGLPRAPNSLSTGTFSIVSTEPSLLAPLEALHQLAVQHRPALEAAAVGRKQAAEEKAAQLAADPPEKKNLTLRYWRLDQPEQASTGKAGAR